MEKIELKTSLEIANKALENFVPSIDIRNNDLANDINQHTKSHLEAVKNELQGKRHEAVKRETEPLLLDKGEIQGIDKAIELINSQIDSL